MTAAEELFQLLYQRAPVPLHAANEASQIVAANQAWLDLLGHPREEVLNRPIVEFLTAESARLYRDTLPAAAARGDAIRDLELQVVPKRGEAIAVALSAQPIGSGAGTVAALRALPTGIKDAETNARDHAYRLLLEGITDYAIFMLDAEGRVSNWNPGAARIKGYTTKEIIGEHFSCFYSEEDRAAGRPGLGLATAAREGRFESEGWRIRKDGSRFWASAVIEAIRDRSGRLIGFAKITRDMTERLMQQEMLEQARAALIQSQKMEAIGQLTGGVAHDFNNLLTAVLGNLELLGRQPEIQSATPQRLIANAKRAVDRGASLTRRLLAFSRRQTLAPTLTDLNRLVAGMSDLLRRTLGERIAVETVLAGGLWAALVDQNQLEAALLNLAVNSRDAMPEGGKLTIETANTYLDEDYAASRSEVTPGQHVMLAVTDTGTGMAPDVQARAFEPFYTTKGADQGTGLGLSQVYGFVKQSGGHVAIYSEPGHGTTVKIYLPRYLGEGSPEPSLERQPALASSQGETVLIVEDDEAVRQYASAALRQLGYNVYEAGDGPSALRILESQTDISLLFSDVVLPGMNGRVLAQEARRRRPKLKVLFTTGYSRNAIVHGGFLEPGVHLLPKPFTIDSLGRKLRQVLDED
jgi:PAS domain S-box-containing protein